MQSDEWFMNSIEWDDATNLYVWKEEGPQPITVWERFYPDTNTWQHNHISDNHTELPAPIAISDLQKSAWKNATWRHRLMYI